MNSFIFVFIGGGLGSITRFGMSKLVTSGFQHINPVSTLVSNVVSTSILGALLYLISHKVGMSPNIKLMLITGFCGGFSTFSTFSFETFELMREGLIYYAILNVVVSLILSIVVLFMLAKFV